MFFESILVLVFNMKKFNGQKNGESINQTLIEEKVKRLVEDIKLYLNRKGIGVDHRRISALMVSLGYQKRVSDVLVMNRVLAYNLFKLLRKYLGNRLMSIEIDLRTLEIRRFIPSLIARLIFDAYESGSVRITSPAKAYGLTLRYIYDGIRKILFFSKRKYRLESLRRSMHREMKQILRIHNVIDEISQSLSSQHVRMFFKPLSSERCERYDIKAKIFVNRLSRKEAIFNIMALLKIVSKRSELLVEENA